MQNILRAPIDADGCELTAKSPLRVKLCRFTLPVECPLSLPIARKVPFGFRPNPSHGCLAPIAIGPGQGRGPQKQTPCRRDAFGLPWLETGWYVERLMAARVAVVPVASVMNSETGVLALRPLDLDAIQPGTGGSNSSTGSGPV
jgi:hypothetical protein